jgi:protein O-GlcNAc transferase
MKSPEEMRAEAEELEARGDEYGALAVWRELVAHRPDPIAFCRFARLAMKLDKRDEAESALRQAINLDASLSEAYLALGSIAINKWDNEEAEYFLRQALSREKTSSGYCMLGRILKRLGRKDEAESAYREALAIDPEFDEAYYNLGALLRTSNPTEAEKLFSKALSIDASYAPAYRELGWISFERGLFGEAEAQIRRAMELEPEDMWAHVYMGHLLWRRGVIEDSDALIQEAEVEFRWAQHAAPEAALPVWTLANLYEDEENFEGARELYERALELEPDNAIANMGFGRMLIKTGEPAAAEVFLERALLLDPDDKRAGSLLDSLKSPPADEEHAAE